MIHSYSSLNTYDICPRQYHHKFVLRDLPKEQTKEQTWGIDVHKAFEARINDDKPFPEHMPYEHFVTPFAHLAPNGFTVRAEVPLGVRWDLSPCDFWDRDVWLRGTLDIKITHGDTGAIFDVKTGKRREDPKELGIHAILLESHHPELKHIYGQYIWLKDNELGKLHDLSLPDTESLIAETKAIEYAGEMDHFPPKQGPLCGWCPVKSCEFHP